ncbi:MAG: hypothetical protein IJU10_00820, partial [Clostridia bacterium]|nr:hypothetical protein [Clostridia bacterium]
MITIGTGKEVRIDRPSEAEPKQKVTFGRDYDGIIRGLDSIKERYDSSLREKAQAYGLEGVTTKTFDTDDDLVARARNELDDKYTPKRNKTQEAYGLTAENAVKERTGLGSSFAGEVRTIREREEARIASEAERYARRGMTDSSVRRLQEVAVRTGAAREVEITDAYYADRVNALNDKLRRAKQSYDEAMRGYDISYAIDLDKKMEKYRAERDKLVAAYEKSRNKEVAKRVKEYLLENQAMNAAYEAENGDYVGEKRVNYRERYEYVLGEMRNMSDREKKIFLETYGDVLKDRLGL